MQSAGTSADGLIERRSDHNTLNPIQNPRNPVRPFGAAGSPVRSRHPRSNAANLAGGCSKSAPSVVKIEGARDTEEVNLQEGVGSAPASGESRTLNVGSGAAVIVGLVGEGVAAVAAAEAAAPTAEAAAIAPPRPCPPRRRRATRVVHRKFRERERERRGVVA